MGHFKVNRSRKRVLISANFIVEVGILQRVVLEDLYDTTHSQPQEMHNKQGHTVTTSYLLEHNSSSNYDLESSEY